MRGQRVAERFETDIGEQHRRNRTVLVEEADAWTITEFSRRSSGRAIGCHANNPELRICSFVFLGLTHFDEMPSMNLRFYKRSLNETLPPVRGHFFFRDSVCNRPVTGCRCARA